MTIPSTPRKAGPYTGNGIQTTFPFAFKVFAASDVDVRLVQSGGSEALLAPESYTVTLNENQETSPGGTITYPLVGAPIGVGSRLAILGAIDYDQPLDLPSGGNFAPLALENQLDRTIMQVQQIAEAQGRALSVPVTSSGIVNPTLPTPDPLKMLAWNSSGTALENVGADSAAFTVAYTDCTFDTFTGNGVQTVFSLTKPPANIANLDLSVDGQTYVPGVDFTLSSNLVTFTAAPSNGAQILARYGQVPGQLPIDVVNAVQGPFLVLDNTITYDWAVPAGKNALSISPTIASGVTVTVPPGSEFITLDEYAGGGAGEANTGANLGTGEGLYAGKTGTTLNFKSLVAGSNITLTPSGNSVTIAAAGGSSGEANTASNVGAGAQVFKAKSGVDLQMRTLVAGTNVTLAQGADTITVSASGGGGTNLGLTNVKDYGAVGNGSTDDTAAFNAALAAINTGIGGTLWIPPGKYRLDGAISATLATSTSIHIMGAGVEVSVLYFAANSGITLTCVDSGYWTKNPSGNAISLSGLSITAGLEPSGTAFKIIGNTLTGRPVPPININNVTVRGDVPNNGFAIGLHFDKADAANVSHYNWFGKILAYQGDAAVITGTSTYNVSAFRFSNCGWTYGANGVTAGDYVEGVHLTNVDMVAFNKGVEWLCSAAVESELAMANCHIAAVLYCVHTRGLMDNHIANSLFFPSGAPTTWNGIRMDYSSGAITNCFFGGANAVSNVGIVHTNLVTGSPAWAVYHPTSITNCCFRAMPTGISLGANTGNVWVSADNQYSVEVTNRVNNSSPSSIVERRNHTGSVVFSLAGGSASEIISINIPANTFIAAPDAAFLVLAQNAEDIIGFYLYDVSTATNAQFILKRRDGGTIPTGARRFSFQMSGL